MPDEQNQPELPARAGGVRGRFVVAITLSLFIIVPTVAVLIAPLLKSGKTKLDLDYDQRHTWFVQPVKPRPLEYSKFVAAETGKQYKKTDLTFDAEVEQTLLRLSKLAQGEGFFKDEDARAELLELTGDEQLGFYPAYLLASWYRANGDAEGFKTWIRVAFDRADCAIVQRLVDDQGEPIKQRTLAPVAIGYDRVVDGKRNANLVLIYPAPTSDATGTIYLPTYRSIYRLTDPKLPIGADPGLHPIRLTLLLQEAKGEKPNWFSVPDGAVGLLPDAVIRPSETK